MNERRDQLVEDEEGEDGAVEALERVRDVDEAESGEGLGVKEGVG